MDYNRELFNEWRSHIEAFLEKKNVKMTKQALNALVASSICDLLIHGVSNEVSKTTATCDRTAGDHMAT